MIVFEFFCPCCGSKLRVPGRVVRPLVRCPVCRTVFRLPGSARLKMLRGRPPACRLAQFFFRSAN